MVSPTGGMSLVSGLGAHQQLGSPWAGGQRPPLNTFVPTLASQPSGQGLGYSPALGFNSDHSPDIYGCFLSRSVSSVKRGVQA